MNVYFSLGRDGATEIKHFTAIQKPFEGLLNLHNHFACVSVVLCYKAPGPIAEIDFWRERSAILSALSEQLTLAVAKKIVAVLTKVDPVTVQNLELSVAELTSYHVEAVQNVRFLSTLERHFKVSHILTTSKLTPNYIFLPNDFVFYTIIKSIFSCKC